MNTFLKRSPWIATGLLLTLGSGPMAWADDTELFIANADPLVTGAKPNILFILDTSGSMDSKVLTQADWDDSLDFAGCFRTNALYISTNGSKPSCGSSAWVYKSANQCAASLGPLASSSGRYDGNVLQWRNRSGSNNDRWEAINTSRRNDDLECQADAGIHGNGGSARYAAQGAPGPWSSNDSNEPWWNQDYTLWNGNWLNWFYGDGEVESTRIEVVKDVTINLLNELESANVGVNVGLMRFNFNDGNNDGGGPIVHEIAPIGTARSTLVTQVNNLPSDGWTPLSETLYEAGQYFAGRSVVFGNQNGVKSVAGSRVGNTMSSNTYNSPIDFTCQKNFVVFLTDGEPTRDTAANNLIKALPGFAAATPSTGPTSTACGNNGDNGHGDCLDEMAEYLNKRDLDDTLPGIQNVITYTIGFAIDLPLLETTAQLGGGRYFKADDTSSLTGALTDIVSSILKEATSFTAPAVPVNAFNRTQNLSDVYVSVFEPSGASHWPGNLKKYRIEGGRLVGQDGQPAVNPDTGFFWNEASNTAFSFWSESPDGDQVRAGGAANELPSYTDRKMYTNLTGKYSVNLVGSAENTIELSDNELQPADFGLAPGDETLMNKTIAWTLGLDVWSLDEAIAGGNPSPPMLPRNIMGDPLHVRPVAIIYGGTANSPEATVFTATNDGVLHAVDPDTGVEKWGFVPKRLLPRQHDLYENPLVSNKRYGLDGEITAYIMNNNGIPGVQPADGEEAYIVFGMRRGGDSVFAMNVTDPERPVLAWEIDSGTSGFEDLGETWSRPSIGVVNVGGSATDVVIIGGGYDNGQDNSGYRTDTIGNAVYMINLETGQKIWSAGNGNQHNLNLDGSGGTYAMQHSIPAPVRAIDLTGDDVIDRMYVGDMGGRVWRFDIANGESGNDLVEGGMLATLGAADLGAPTAADIRRFYSAPDVVAIIDTPSPYVAINIGSGHRAHPLDTATGDEFFSIRDFKFFGPIPRDEYTDPITRADLEDVTTFSPDAYPVLDPDALGWRIRMVLSSGEKILTESITFNKTVFFTSFAPGSDASACTTSKGTNRVYQVNVTDGSPRLIDDPYDPQDPQDPLTPDDRVTTLKQGGIAPETILLFTPEVTACAGVECFDPGFNESANRTYWFQDETR